MTTTTISIAKPQAVQLPAVSLESISKVTMTGLLTLLGTFAFIMIAFCLTRAAGVSALCYDGITTQAASTGTFILPFAVYSVLLASKHSLKRVAIVGSIVAAVYGALLAATV